MHGKRLNADISKEVYAATCQTTPICTVPIVPLHILTVQTSTAAAAIATGGAGNMQHFEEAFTTGKADAALAASLFHFKELEIPTLKKFLAERGVVVRFTPAF